MCGCLRGVRALACVCARFMPVPVSLSEKTMRVFDMNSTHVPGRLRALQASDDEYAAEMDSYFDQIDQLSITDS